MMADWPRKYSTSGYLGHVQSRFPRSIITHVQPSRKHQSYYLGVAFRLQGDRERKWIAVSTLNRPRAPSCLSGTCAGLADLSWREL
jgi:hypothetical protein